MTEMLNLLCSLVLVIPSIAASRLMFSIRSLAIDVHSTSPDLLLSMSELSRVRWKPGLRPGELHVEVDAVEDSSEYEMREVDEIITHDELGQQMSMHSIPKTRMPQVYVSRVGTFDTTC